MCCLLQTGRDASRALATFDLGAPPKYEYDDLSDLGPAELEGMRDWARDFESSIFCLL